MNQCEKIWNQHFSNTQTRCCVVKQRDSLFRQKGRILNGDTWKSHYHYYHTQRGPRPRPSRVSPVRRCRHFFFSSSTKVFTFSISSFRSVYNVFLLLPLRHSAHRFTSKPDQLALDASLPEPLRGPSSHSVPPLVPWSLCRQRARGALGLKGRTPDGHRRVGHVLCDGVWLGAVWASHSCQS